MFQLFQTVVGLKGLPWIWLQLLSYPPIPFHCTQASAEEGYNTSTITLISVEGDENGTGARGYNWVSLPRRDINRET
jgi:hypothetical protein